MKKMKFLLTILILIIAITSITTVHAESYDNQIDIVRLRAGGGGSGGGGSSSGGSGGHASGAHGGTGYDAEYCGPICILGNIVEWILILCFLFFTTIVFYVKVFRSSINSKKYLKMLSKKDITWKYKSIEKQAIATFYAVQYAWTKMDMKPAKSYMSNDLYERFVGKLEWMKLGNKRNVLKRIRLTSIKPISVYDDEDDEKDLVWFYIRGNMVDYIINTETYQKEEGNDFFGLPFIEFWKFTRKGNKWVLTKILQYNEKNQIIFQ